MSIIKQLSNNRFHIKSNGMNKINVWLRENITETRYVLSNSDHQDRPPSMIVWFLDETDSMAFKLRWS